MKCNKCGEENKENQAFCLKCGNPIQVVPDINLIEAELASNIGELMDKIDYEGNTDNFTKEIPIDEMELKLVDISRNATEENMEDKTKVIGNFKEFVNEKSNQEDTNEEIEKDDEIVTPETKNNKKNKKKTAIIIGVICALLVAVVLAFVLIATTVEHSSTSFDEYYDNALSKYEEMDTEGALKDAKNALDKASNDKEKIKIRALIYDINMLAAIIELGTKDAKYYKALAKYYDDNEKYNDLTNLLLPIEDDIIISELKDYYVNEPKADFESGEYSSYMAVSLSADEGCKIRYTDDSRNPSSYGVDYNGAIQITKEGETVIKAVVINEKGVESKIITLTYNIKLSGSNTPKVTPKGGAYVEHTKIKIEVPEGGKAYFTWDGTAPTEESEEYKEEIDMLRGINVLKVIVIDKYDIKSDVAQESYNLQIPREITLNDAVELVQQKAEEGLAEGETANASYETTDIIENNEYYIIIATIKDNKGKQKSITIYAVNTLDKSVNIATDADGSYVIEE